MASSVEISIGFEPALVLSRGDSENVTKGRKIYSKQSDLVVDRAHGLLLTIWNSVPQALSGRVNLFSNLNDRFLNHLANDRERG